VRRTTKLPRDFINIFIDFLDFYYLRMMVKTYKYCWLRPPPQSK